MTRNPNAAARIIDEMVKAAMEGVGTGDADAIVCMRADTEPGTFDDDLIGVCFKCGTKVRYRPYMPALPKICLDCAGLELPRKMEGDMIPLNIRFHADREEVIFPEDDKPGMTAVLTDAVVVANGIQGTDRDRPSVVFRFEEIHGETYGAALTSARLIVTLARMILERHPDLMEGE